MLDLDLAFRGSLDLVLLWIWTGFSELGLGFSLDSDLVFRGSSDSVSFLIWTWFLLDLDSVFLLIWI